MAQILEPRVQELFELVKAELQRSGYQELTAAGLVLTGGSSLLHGMVELAEETFDSLPVRLGRPQGVGGLVDVVSSPMYATGVGLILYGQAYRQQTPLKINERNMFSKVWKRMRSWFGDST
jgi:cell division protein FtsA